MKTIIYLILPALFLVLSCRKTVDNNNVSIRGSVTDSLNNKPIKDVSIQLYKEELFSEFPIAVDGYNTSTDSLGKFTLNFKREDAYVAYYIEVKKDGYTHYTPNFGSLIDVDLNKKQSLIIKMLKIN